MLCETCCIYSSLYFPCMHFSESSWLFISLFPFYSLRFYTHCFFFRSLSTFSLSLVQCCFFFISFPLLLLLMIWISRIFVLALCFFSCSLFILCLILHRAHVAAHSSSASEFQFCQCVSGFRFIAS